MAEYKDRIEIQSLPHITIIKQPAPVMRNRYGSEKYYPKIVGADHSSLPSNPTIQISGFCGRAQVVVSCVTKGEPFQPHPNELKGQPLKERKSRLHPNECADEEFDFGILLKRVFLMDDMLISFPNLHLSQTKIRDAESALQNRQHRRIQRGIVPYAFRLPEGRNAAPLKKQDFKELRLCFEVFVEMQGPNNTPSWMPMSAVVSDPIILRKSTTNFLRIYKLSHMSASVAGGQEVMMFCDKIDDSSDVEVRFSNNDSGWYANAFFDPSSDVHQKCGICFKTPAYYDQKISEPVTVSIQLRQRSDGSLGEELPFLLTPLILSSVERKKRKLDQNFSQFVYNNLRSTVDSKRGPEGPFIDPVELSEVQQSPEYAAVLIPNVRCSVNQEVSPPKPYVAQVAGIESNPFSSEPDRIMIMNTIQKMLSEPTTSNPQQGSSPASQTLQAPLSDTSVHQGSPELILLDENHSALTNTAETLSALFSSGLSLSEMNYSMSDLADLDLGDSLIEEKSEVPSMNLTVGRKDDMRKN